MREAQGHEPLQEGSKPRSDSGPFARSDSDTTSALPNMTAGSKPYLGLRQSAAVTDAGRTGNLTHDTRAAAEQTTSDRLTRTLRDHGE